MRTLFGLLILLVGLGLLLQAFGVVSSDRFYGIGWPVILILVGVMSWGTNRRLVFGPLILFGLGVIFLLSNLDAIPGSAWDYVWPVVIILVGLRLILGRRWNELHAKDRSGGDVFAAFAGREERVTGEYRGGSSSAFFGGTKIDLRQATVIDGSRIEVFAAFGGIEILAPKNVKVVTKVLPLFGGADNKTEPDPSASATMTVSGTALFGGVEVKN